MLPNSIAVGSHHPVSHYLSKVTGATVAKHDCNCTGLCVLPCFCTAARYNHTRLNQSRFKVYTLRNVLLAGEFPQSKASVPGKSKVVRRLFQVVCEATGSRRGKFV